MPSNYDEFCQIVIANGWKRSKPATFTKDGLELVFDTSSYIEVYRGSERVAEIRVSSPQDVTAFLSTFTQ